jgi:hypothetical protein
MTNEEIAQKFADRLVIYRMKHSAADPFAEDIYNRWGATQYVIEAIELLAYECGIQTELNEIMDEPETER